MLQLVELHLPRNHRLSNNDSRSCDQTVEDGAVLMCLRVLDMLPSENHFALKTKRFPETRVELYIVHEGKSSS